MVRSYYQVSQEKAKGVEASDMSYIAVYTYHAYYTTIEGSHLSLPV